MKEDTIEALIELVSESTIMDDEIMVKSMRSEQAAAIDEILAMAEGLKLITGEQSAKLYNSLFTIPTRQQILRQMARRIMATT